MKVIVGLGNPGKKYENTRHNIGFRIIDEFAFKNNVSFKKKFDALIGEVNINGEKVLLVKPQTFMNLSGISARKIVDYYDLNINDILICYDDLDLDFSIVRLKRNSSSGGHNGIKNIIEQLHTMDFLRVKFGIKNEFKKNTVDFVLSNFSKSEEKEIELYIGKCIDIIYDFCNGVDNSTLMNSYN